MGSNRLEPVGEGVNGKWQHGAELADGQFMSIDHNQRVVKIDTPQDKKITELNTALNKTYIAYGSKKTREAQS